MDSLGTLHAVWVDDRDGGTRGAIYYARRPARAEQWRPNSRVAGPGGADARLDPAVTVDAAGRVHVVWTEFHGGDPDIYHSLLPAGGQVWTAPRRINDDVGPAIQWHPSAAADLWGTAHFAWTDERAGSADIYSTRLTVDGWWAPNARINQAAPGIQGHARLTGTPGGDIHAVWEDTRHGRSAIFASRLPPGGDTWWPDAELSVSAGRALQRRPWVTADGSGAIQAVWVDEGPGDGGALRLATLRPGEPYWDMDRVIYQPTNGNLLSVSAAAGADGSVLAFWGETRPGTSRVYSALVAPDGQVQRERVDSSPSVTAGTDPVAVLDADGRATVLWRGLPARQSHGEIYVSTAQLAPPTYGSVRLEGWLQYRTGEETCTGEGYAVVACDGIPSHMILNPDQLNLPPLLGSYVALDGVLKDRDGCPRVEATHIRLTTTPCPRQTGAVTGMLRAGGAPVAGAAIEIAGETVATGPSGRFFFDLLPVGGHPLTATLPCALDARAGPIAVRPGVLTDAGSGQLVLGDVIADCVIDLQDLVAVAGQYKSQPPFYPACTDLDADGTVSLYDLVAVAAGYGQSCPTQWLTGRSRGDEAGRAVAAESHTPDAAGRELGLRGGRTWPGRSAPAPYANRPGEAVLRLDTPAGATGWRLELAYDANRTPLVDAQPAAPGLQPFVVLPQLADQWVVENEADAAAGRLRLTVVLLGPAPELADGAAVATVRTTAAAPAGELYVTLAALAGRGGTQVPGTVWLDVAPSGSRTAPWPTLPSSALGSPPD